MMIKDVSELIWPDFLVVYTTTEYGRICNNIATQSPNEYFDPHEYVTCDSAYSPNDHTIPAYKCASGYLMLKENHDFNTFLGSPELCASIRWVYGKGGSRGSGES